MTDKRFEIKPTTYFVGGKEWLSVGIYDTQGDLTKALLDSEICALLENQHERIQALEAQIKTLETLHSEAIPHSDGQQCRHCDKWIFETRLIYFSQALGYLWACPECIKELSPELAEEAKS